MKVPMFTILLISVSFFLGCSGCTQIETPTRNETPSQSKALLLYPESYEILDTEPLRIEADGGSGEIFWETDPSFDNCFQPEKGAPVLFTPPDLSDDLILGIIASDGKENARIDITVIDEGPPPAPGDVLINEIAWAGTHTSSYDEYVEIINNTDRVFYLNNWRIENAAGVGNPFIFSGKLFPSSLFLIANYGESSEKSSITVRIDRTDAALSLPNLQAGPYILMNSGGMIFDTVCDGGEYLHGKNEQEVKASMARLSTSSSRQWEPASWYTESVSVNLSDGTLGTPGAQNSDKPLSEQLPAPEIGDAARAIITEFYIDLNDGKVEDWVELYITKEGNVKYFIVSDLDGDSDSSITDGEDCFLSAGEYIQVIWSTAYHREGNRFFIPDVNPTGTKDELVLLCATAFLDGLCYCSTDELQFDDLEEMRGYGWSGDPVCGKRAARKRDESGLYLGGLQAEIWDLEAEPTPGVPNQ